MSADSYAARARRYADGVLSGSITVGKWVRLAVERNERDFKNGVERGLRFDDEAGTHACEFFERFLCHSKGKWAGCAFLLEDWQVWWIYTLFGWMRADGTRRFRVAYQELARKNGKSQIAAGVGLYLTGPDAEPGAEVYSAATKRDQAKIVWGEAKRMLARSPRLRKHLTALAQNIHSTRLGSKYEALGADGDTMDGLNIHGAIVDELHAHKTRAVWDVIVTATGARSQPLIFAITTAGSGKHSVCREQHDYGEAVLSGLYPEAETDSFFALIYAIDEDDDWRSPACWAKANPNLGVSVNPDDLAEKCERAKRSPSQQNAFRRLHLNVWTEQETRWLDLDEWDACNQYEIEPTAIAGRKCWLGLDLSNNRDLTALAAVFEPMEPGGPYDVKVHFWCPADTVAERTEQDRVPYDVWAAEELIQPTPGNVIDHSFVVALLDEYLSEYDVQELAFDRWGSPAVIAALEDLGFSTEPDERKRGGAPLLVQFGQGFRSMGPASKEFETWLLQRKVNHGGNPILRWMASNVVARMDPTGAVKPDKEKSREKIDGIVAVIMAIDRASRGGGDSGSVYDERGMLEVG